MSNILQHYEESKPNKISIYCYSSEQEVSFFSFITNFTDQVNASWNNQVVYSRMDPLYTYKSTTRKINISFDVPSYNLEEAKSNYEDINTLLDSMYPMFEDEKLLIGASIIKGPPLFSIEFANYISDEADHPLLGIIQNLSFKPEFESGFFIDKEAGKETQIFPKLFKLNFTFDVLHIVNETGVTSIGRYITNNEIRTQQSVRQQLEEEAIVEKLPPDLQITYWEKKLKELENDADELSDGDQQEPSIPSKPSVTAKKAVRQPKHSRNTRKTQRRKK